MDADGRWSVPITIPEAGSYRVFADFEHDGEKTALAADLAVDGPRRLGALPAPSDRAVVPGGYEVQLGGKPARAGRTSELAFTVTRAGQPVETEPYLGAGGHLVALREGDLAYLHTHPEAHGDDAAVRFETEFPSAGRYRLFLQFKHQGRVRTAAFTQEVGR